jgi:murein DD-endopeptidase MepM/ murein hydrolase activator NlpD
MAAFTISMSGPFPSGFTSGIGGPNTGDHQGPHWYNQFGMDLGAVGGTVVRAAFEGHITKIEKRPPSSGKEYGAKIFMRSPNEMMGGFYTHIADVPDALDVDSTVRVGDTLGTVIDRAPAHLHLALVEIIGGGPGGTYKGVNLYSVFLDMAKDPSAVRSVTFNQDGSPPSVA